ncbi:T9SS type A sorting domain-containing protein [candidate division KSB1 bacterium]|nr:T9SS type A sorting domain-containing protein [candidate division KSB1 bacterium]
MILYKYRWAGCLLLIPLILLLMSVGAAEGQSSTNYIIQNYVFDQGGARSQSANKKVIDAIGQPSAVGSYGSTNYKLSAGLFTPAVNAPPIYPVVTSPQIAGGEFWVDIYVGTDEIPASNLFGVSFNLNFTNTTIVDVLTPHSSNVVPGSFLGNDVIFFQSVDESAGKVSIGNSRKSGAGGVSGSGPVARIMFKIASGATDGETISFSITNAEATDPSGTNLTIDPQSDSTTVQAGVIVWPGDTNDDGIVNQADVLPLGLHWGSTGDPRTDHANELEWIAHVASPWTPLNATYADANGDGVVDQADVLPIGLNWAKTHSRALQKNIASGLNKSNSGSLTIEIEGEPNPNQDFFINVYVNDATNLFGLSFELIYMPTTFIDPMTAEPGPDNLMGDDLIYFPNINETDGDSGIVSVGISRKAGQGAVNGSGLVTQVTAHMSGDAQIDESSTSLYIKNVVANDPEGNPIEFGLDDYELVTDVANASKEIPTTFELYENYPNPFNPQTNIRYQLPKSSDVSLIIYDLRGQEVRRLVSAEKTAGSHTAVWDGRDNQGNIVASGLYLYQIQAGKFRDVKKCLLLK